MPKVELSEAEEAEQEARQKAKRGRGPGAKPESKKAVRVCISLPREMKDRMGSCAVNWSAVCQDAIKKALSEDERIA
jgi:hypothetical protein